VQRYTLFSGFLPDEEQSSVTMPTEYQQL